MGCGRRPLLISQASPCSGPVIPSLPSAHYSPTRPPVPHSASHFKGVTCDSSVSSSCYRCSATSSAYTFFICLASAALFTPTHHMSRCSLPPVTPSCCHSSLILASVRISRTHTPVSNGASGCVFRGIVYFPLLL
ncbi:hypothetical protein E2C01_048241 [Portunus trituberculatus]|uniref:Uncharacterized protein n=1 Tax=Portunus trituberculatus TaxID=210409 RepID=A0A5B7G365_PORTR|nr:hypothetical protein [Portunus trituberculatus]